MKKVIRLNERDLNKLVKRIVNEGLRVNKNAQQIASQINGLPNKTVQATVEGNTIVFLFADQRVGLDCTQASPNTAAPAQPQNEQRYDPSKPVAGGRMNQPQPSQGNKLVMCSTLGVKSPGYCDTKLKKPVDRCASLGVKSPGWCYVDTKQPVPNVQPMDNRPMKDSRGGAVGKSISHT